MTLSSERLGVIAKIDVVKADEGIVMPVDFKKGKRPHVAAGAYEPETTTDWRGLFSALRVPAGSRLRVSVQGPQGGDPVLAETHFIPQGVPAVVESLIVPPAE